MTDRPFASLTFAPGVHGAARFDSGEPNLDDWLRKHASSAMRARVARTFVWIPADSDAVVAYYSLSAHAVTDKGRDLYAACGCLEVPGNPSRMIVSAKVAASTLGR